MPLHRTAATLVTVATRTRLLDPNQIQSQEDHEETSAAHEDKLPVYKGNPWKGNAPLGNPVSPTRNRIDEKITGCLRESC